MSAFLVQGSVIAIEWDNQESYEDHHCDVVLCVPSFDVASDVTAFLTRWVDRARTRIPKEDFSLEGEDWWKLHEARQFALKKLKPPFGLRCLVKDVEQDRSPDLRAASLRVIGRVTADNATKRGPRAKRAARKPAQKTREGISSVAASSRDSAGVRSYACEGRKS